MRMVAAGTVRFQFRRTQPRCDLRRTRRCRRCNAATSVTLLHHHRAELVTTEAMIAGLPKKAREGAGPMPWLRAFGVRWRRIPVNATSPFRQASGTRTISAWCQSSAGPLPHSGHGAFGQLAGTPG